MSDAKNKSEDGGNDLRIVRSVPPTVCNMHKARIRIIPLLITLATTGCAVVFGWAMWNAYMGAPWTRDGTCEPMSSPWRQRSQDVLSSYRW